MKTAALGAVTASATATGIIGSLKNAQAAPAGPPKGGAPKPGAGGPPGPPPSFKHDQEFSVITLGTGNPIPDANRASSGTAVQYKGKYYIMDTGNGVNNVMAENGYAFSDIRAIMFTHLHADHTTDFIDIMINRWMTGGKELEIIGPPRSGGYYKFMTEFFADDLIYRKFRGIKMGVTDAGMFSGVNVKEYTGSNTFKLDGMKVQTAEMIHTQYDLAYRFDVDGKSIVVTGDTSYTEELIKLAKNADILVIDTNLTNARAKDSSEGEAFTDKSIVKPKPIYEYSGNFEVAPHMGIAEVAKTAAAANVKTVVMTHLSPAPVNIEVAMKYFKEAGFKGKVIEAKDGLEINP
ncbi:MBL fold metallo-hydrolase [Verrucomicrobia bacterium]|nr:MBL fold metallo-hydrolase [Verrucomicrobiota bacterium]